MPSAFEGEMLTIDSNNSLEAMVVDAERRSQVKRKLT